MTRAARTVALRCAVPRFAIPLALAIVGVVGCAGSTPPPASGASASGNASASADTDSRATLGAPAQRVTIVEPASKDKSAADPPTPHITATRTSTGGVGIKRSELDSLLKRGANNFIGLIDVRAAFRRGRFLGWRVLDYRGPGLLHKGDVVLRVNGQSVERPGQFIGVWQRLARAKVLVIEVLRRGKRVRWAFAIIEG